jgi:aldose 1-epimerase
MKKLLIQSIILAAGLSILGCGAKTKKTGSHTYMNKKHKIQAFTLTNNHGAKVIITNFGGRIMSLQAPDKYGLLGDVVLGYEKPMEYINGNPYFGALIGRYGNRIDEGNFSLNGETYRLPTNNGPNHLHGGPKGFHNVLWDVDTIKNKQAPSLQLSYVSKDGEMGYPGRLQVKITYTWTDDYELKIDYHATSNKKTIVNLTNHSFFNLKDGGKGKITGHHLKLYASRFTPVDSTLIPTGEIRKVEGTPMDFTESKPIGKDINKDYRQLEYGKGYDHNFVLKKPEQGKITLAAEVFEPTTGRKMQVYTTEPGLQFYSGNFLDGSDVGKEGVQYDYRSAFCLEAQHYPDSPNHDNFPSTALEPGEKYTQQTIYKFSTGQ